jgi:hypothetical protein
MLGPSLEGDNRGIIPRALEQVAQGVAESESLGWKFKITASFIEIYMETIQVYRNRPFLLTRSDGPLNRTY